MNKHLKNINDELKRKLYGNSKSKRKKVTKAKFKGSPYAYICNTTLS
jgi:hypothetical protein